MVNYQNVMEYREELFSLSAEQMGFLEKLAQKYNKPVKMLRIACETGRLELELAKSGKDIIGIESSLKMIEAANRRKKQQMHNVRFFFMRPQHIADHFPNRFFDIIYCLNDRLIFIHDKTQMEQFFFDCRALLAPGGRLVLQLNNYSALEQSSHALPDIRAPRCIIKRKINNSANDSFFSMHVETGTGKLVSIIEEEPVFPIAPDVITTLAQKSGFTEQVLYEDYTGKAFTNSSKTLVCELS